MKKKVRRPKEIVELIKLDSDFIYIYPTVFGYGLSTKEAKRLHAWLGRAIEYLEQQKGRKRDNSGATQRPTPNASRQTAKRSGRRLIRERAALSL